jgi:hypothetical protein
MSGGGRGRIMDDPFLFSSKFLRIFTSEGLKKIDKIIAKVKQWFRQQFCSTALQKKHQIYEHKNCMDLKNKKSGAPLFLQRISGLKNSLKRHGSPYMRNEMMK